MMKKGQRVLFFLINKEIKIIREKNTKHTMVNLLPALKFKTN